MISVVMDVEHIGFLLRDAGEQACKCAGYVLKSNAHPAETAVFDQALVENSTQYRAV